MDSASDVTNLLSARSSLESPKGTDHTESTDGSTPAVQSSFARLSSISYAGSPDALSDEPPLSVKPEDPLPLHVQEGTEWSAAYRGVYYRGGRWNAQIQHAGKKMYIGAFPDAETAARAYDHAASRYHGSRALRNFTPSGDLIVENLLRRGGARERNKDQYSRARSAPPRSGADAPRRPPTSFMGKSQPRHVVISEGSEKGSSEQSSLAASHGSSSDKSERSRMPSKVLLTASSTSSPDEASSGASACVDVRCTTPCLYMGGESTYPMTSPSLMLPASPITLLKTGMPMVLPSLPPVEGTRLHSPFPVDSMRSNPTGLASVSMPFLPLDVSHDTTAVRFPLALDDLMEEPVESAGARSGRKRSRAVSDFVAALTDSSSTTSPESST